MHQYTEPRMGIQSGIKAMLDVRAARHKADTVIKFRLQKQGRRTYEPNLHRCNSNTNLRHLTTGHIQLQIIMPQDGEWAWFSRSHDQGVGCTNQGISPSFSVTLCKGTLASELPLLRQALPVFSATRQAQGKALASPFAPGSLMKQYHELSQPSFSVDLNSDGCYRSGISHLPLNPSPSLQFPLWVALAVEQKES